MKLKDIKLGIEVNGLDETLNRLCDMINDQEKQIELLTNKVIELSVDSCVNKINQSLYSKR